MDRHIQRNDRARGAHRHGTPPDGGAVRMVHIAVGEYRLTVNPVDGSEIQPCPPGQRPAPATVLAADARPAPELPAPGAHGRAEVPLLEREEERGALARLLAQGRSIRVTGGPGSGRSALLDAVAEDAAELAPHGVVRLDGTGAGTADLLHALFAATHSADPLRRPGEGELRAALRSVGAVVVVDGLECGGPELDAFLHAIPECAVLAAADPDLPAPSAELEEFPLRALSRTACLELLECVTDRPLTDAEADRASDLWWDAGGTPLLFVQLGAVLRQDSTFAAPLSVQAAAGAGRSAQEVLRIAAALGGPLPHPAHLPALTDDPAAAEAVAELVAAGLVTCSGGSCRTAPGAAEELGAAGWADGAEARVTAVAQHYAWWSAHPSVTPGRVADEAETVHAAVAGALRHGHPSTAVLLARQAAPAFAAALRWRDWRRMLEAGAQAARATGEVTEEAYFHHESGILAFCDGDLARAREQLEAAAGLRGALDEGSGAVAGLRALALVEDREVRDRNAETVPRAAAPPPAPAAPVHAPPAGRGRPGGGRKGAAVAGVGVLLAAVAGTVVGLGALSSTPSGASGERADDRNPATNSPELTADERESGTGSGAPASSPGTPDEGSAGGAPGPTREAPAPSVSSSSGASSPAEGDGTGTRPGGSSRPGGGASSGDPSGTPGTPGGSGGGNSGGGSGGDSGGGDDGGADDGGTTDGSTGGDGSDGGTSGGDGGGETGGGETGGGGTGGDGGGESPGSPSPSDPSSQSAPPGDAGGGTA